MSDLPIVAWAEYARESLIGVSMQYDEESPFLQRALTDHAAATTSLTSAQQRIEELERALGELVPGPYYMDPPDGGSVTLMEQLRRMAHDAARYRWLRDTPKIADVRLVGTGLRSGEGLDKAIDAALARPDEPALSKAYLSGVSPQSAWPFAQDDKGTK